MKLRHVVVDGSNIATEGRETPSLAQLDEAVQAFIREFEPELVTVVVDATFPNRIDRKERKVYEEAVAAGEVITPPAGAIGRGDAFVLQIADRAGATVLSNDSFQEFHGDYHWLFDQGRLVGGKPVTHVGWVFMGRTPVRGPASRRATGVTKRGKAKEAARPDTARPDTARPEAAAPREAPAKRRRSGRRGDAAADTAPPADAAEAVKAVRPAKADASSGRGRSPKGEAAPTREATQAEPKPAPAAPPPAVADAPDATTTPAYNEPGPFGDFLSKHPVGSGVEAVVESFGSHGAYLRCGRVRAYSPLKNLADPAPRSAKEVVKVGETRTFVVAEIDRARRGVDLALTGTPAARTAAAAKPAEQPRKAAKQAKAPKATRSDRAAKAAKARKASKAAKATKSDRAAKATKPEAQADRPAKKAGRSAKKAAKKSATDSRQ